MKHHPFQTSLCNTRGNTLQNVADRTAAGPTADKCNTAEKALHNVAQPAGHAAPRPAPSSATSPKSVAQCCTAPREARHRTLSASATRREKCCTVLHFLGRPRVLLRLTSPSRSP